MTRPALIRNLFLLTLFLLSAPASAKTTFLHSYRERQKELDRFADLSSQDYKRLAQNVSQSRGETLYGYQYPGESEDDPDLGRKERASSQIRHILRTDHEIIYDAVYSFDQFSRRVSPVDHPERREKFIILSGCSFTYGNGLNDDQTLNYYLGKNLPDYYPYNYGIGATGANSTLALVEENRFHKEIPQKQGVFIYVSLGENHVDRTTGKLPSLTWLWNAPYYEVNGEEVVRHGSFASGRPRTTKFYLYIQKLFNRFGLSNRVFPPLTASDFHDQCMIAKKTRDTFLAQYPGSRFIYFLHPYANQPPELDNCLRSHGVELVRGGLKSPREEISIKIDGHPGSKANEEIAAELAEVIKGHPGSL